MPVDFAMKWSARQCKPRRSHYNSFFRMKYCSISHAMALPLTVESIRLMNMCYIWENL
ncbi:UNVERIFIED_CONTAM: hypothetical protein FKN15_001733 [Acipenser sinensis]